MRVIVVVATLLGLSAIAPISATPPEDATLRAVQFADAREGWAVGDQGVIWHTIDSGKTWERQVSGSKASLRSVSFLSPYLGYAVGRQELPNRVGSAGVILKTTDGGITWTELSSSTLPGLNVVKFFDERRGLVAGQLTDLFPSGVFITEDGGLTWKPIDTQGGPWTLTDWTEFVTGQPDDFVLLAEGVAYGQFQQNQCKQLMPVDAPELPATWVKPRKQPTTGLSHHYYFLNESVGWAVGELGNIRHTQDGGATWTLQKSGGQRVALLCVNARSDEVPWPLIALESGKEGYLSAALSFQPGDAPRLSAALRMVGGNIGLTAAMPLQGAYIHEPLPEGGPQLLKTIRSEEAIAQLVQTIRKLRPEVIVCDAGSTLAQQWVVTQLREAITVAADPKVLTTGFEPHTVKKLYAASTEGEVALDLTIFHPELGDCLLDYSESARHLFSYQPAPSRVCFKLLSSTIPGAEAHKSVMQGIELAEGGTGRRKKPVSSAALVASLPQREALAKTRRQLEALFSEPLTRDRTEATLAKALVLLQTVPEAAVPRVAVDLGFRFADAGQWTAARELFSGVAEHYAVRAEAVEAMRWLVKYQCSGEVRRRLERGDFPIFQRAAFTPVEASPIRTVSTLENALPKPVLKFINPEALRQWHQAGLDLQPKLAAFGTMYMVDVDTLLPLVVARRNLGLHARALGILQQLVPHESSFNAAQSRLIAERNILDNKPGELVAEKNPHPLKIKPVVTPQLTSQPSKTRPVLDGKLDDDCWKQATAVSLAGATLGQAGYRTRMMMSHDDQFLYVAMMCEHPDGQAVEPVARRGHDADLRGHDRVELLLDLDRDYQTSYRLCVDHRGLVADDCWGDKSWNPKWFVATEPSAKGWVAELAIPFSELSDTPPSAGDRWALNLVRTVPTVGQDSWGGHWEGTPSAANMGLLNYAKQ